MSLKFYVCKKIQPMLEFQNFKSCQTCRKKKAKKDVIPIVSLEPAITVQNTIETKEPKQWCLLSGKWIRKGEEKLLHNLLLKKVNRQFLNRCAFPVHKYLTKDLMIVIRVL